MTLAPPIAAIGSIGIEVFGPSPGHAKWGVALWGDDVWGVSDWQDVTPQSMSASASWGADDGSKGVLSVCSAGTWNVRTYDPDRKLDPSNVSSHLHSVLHPGSKVRVRYTGATPRTVKRGVIDEITYDLDTETGSIRATDGVAILQGANIAAASTAGAPTTLRARARWLLDKAHIVDITVEADPPDGDPTIGPAPTEAATVWDWITTAALDVLRAVWLSPDNVLKFRSFGDPNDLGLAIGGDDGIPVDNLTPQSSLSGVVATVIGYDVAAPTVKITQTNEATREYAGTNVFERTRAVPGGALWVANVLADRSGASLQYRLGTLRPRTDAELVSILDTGMVDIAHIAITKRNQGREVLASPIEASARILGGTIRGDTATGWNATLVTYVTAAEWADAEVPPPEPPIPPVTTQTVTRTYVCNKDSRAFLSSSGQNLGSGTEGELPVGYWSSSKNRAFLGFATIPWSDVLEVVSAELRITTSTQVNIGFGSSPKIRVRRITSSWSEGSASSPSAGNALIWPGPTVTSSGERVEAISTSQGHLEIIPITTIARAWAPAAAGGSAAKNYGLALYSYGESSLAYTTEFWAREHGTSTDAEIRITVKIPA